MRRGRNQRCGAAGRARSGESGARPSSCQAEALAEGAVSARRSDVITPRRRGGEGRGGMAAARTFRKRREEPEEDEEDEELAREVR